MSGHEHHAATRRARRSVGGPAHSHSHEQPPTPHPRQTPSRTPQPPRTRTRPPRLQPTRIRLRLHPPRPHGLPRHLRYLRPHPTDQILMPNSTQVGGQVEITPAAPAERSPRHRHRHRDRLARDRLLVTTSGGRSPGGIESWPCRRRISPRKPRVMASNCQWGSSACGLGVDAVAYSGWAQFSGSLFQEPKPSTRRRTLPAIAGTVYMYSAHPAQAGAETGHSLADWSSRPRSTCTDPVRTDCAPNTRLITRQDSRVNGAAGTDVDDRHHCGHIETFRIRVTIPVSVVHPLRINTSYRPVHTSADAARVTTRCGEATREIAMVTSSGGGPRLSRRIIIGSVVVPRSWLSAGTRRCRARQGGGHVHTVQEPSFERHVERADNFLFYATMDEAVAEPMAILLGRHRQARATRSSTVRSRLDVEVLRRLRRDGRRADPWPAHRSGGRQSVVELFLRTRTSPRTHARLPRPPERSTLWILRSNKKILGSPGELVESTRENTPNGSPEDAAGGGTLLPAHRNLSRRFLQGRNEARRKPIDPDPGTRLGSEAARFTKLGDLVDHVRTT